MSLHLDEYIEREAELHAASALGREEDYQFLATPLKSAALIRKERYEELFNFYQCRVLRSEIEQAEKIVSEDPAASMQVVKEVGQVMNTVRERLEDPALDIHKLLCFRDLCGISNESLLEMFSKAQKLILDKRFQEAKALLTYLNVMAPRVTGFWISLGVCFENLGDFDEALAAYQVAKSISAEDPQPCLCLCHCFLSLKDYAQAREELQNAEMRCRESPALSQEWMPTVEQLKLKTHQRG